MNHPALGAYYATTYNQAIEPDSLGAHNAAVRNQAIRGLGRWYQDESRWGPVSTCRTCATGSVDAGKAALYLGGAALLGLVAVMLFSGDPRRRA